MSTPNRQSVSLEARRWVVRLDELSGLEKAQLDRWLEESELHRAEFEAARARWESLDFLQQLQGDPVEHGDPAVARKRVRRERSRRYAWPLAAAAAVAAMAIAIGWSLWPREYQTELYTGVGEQLEVSLPDDSVVLLNTRTRLRVHFSGEERSVFLDSGEAHFDVSHDPGRPFVVVAGTGVVRAVGTAFTVYVREEQTEVTVTDGEVEISKRPNPSAAVAAAPVDTSRPLQRVSKAQTARISHDDVEAVAAVDPDVIERKLAWHHGMLEFVNAPLSEVIADAGRYTSKTLVIADPELENYRVTVVARTDNINGLLRNLDNSTDAFNVTHISENRVIISSARPHPEHAN